MTDANPTRPRNARSGASGAGRSGGQAAPSGRRYRHQASQRKRAEERGALSHARGRRAESPAISGSPSCALRSPTTCFSRRLAGRPTRPSVATSPTSWASSATCSGSRITSERSRARPSATNRRARPVAKAVTFASRIDRASTSRAKCAASSRWPRISRRGEKSSSSSKPNKPSSSARTRISSNSPMSRRTT